jgi:Ser/Thr protein kinase RdoA (MazF antagonist)
LSDEFQDLPAEEQAARLSGLALQALARWGTQGCDPRLIKFRENAVFEVIDRTGQRAALRVHRQNYHSDAALSAELEWMAMLADGGITVPRPVPSVDGAVLVKESSDEVPGYWQIDMLSWLDGVELGEIGEPLTARARRPRFAGPVSELRPHRRAAAQPVRSLAASDERYAPRLGP